MTSTDAILEEAANGNPAALDFLRKLIKLSHRMDDVVDCDITDRDQIVRVFMEVVTFYSVNEFFQMHKAHLYPIIICSMDNYANSVNWEGSTDDCRTRLADVLRSTLAQVVHFVALLTSGGDVNSMRNVSAKNWLDSWQAHHDSEGKPV